MIGLLWLALAVDCGKCHTAQSTAHAKTLMAQTLERGESARILAMNPKLEFTLGPYRYAIERNTYIVADGRETFVSPIRWAIGQGDAGQTYIIEKDHKLYESRVSYYRSKKGLEITMGAPAGVPKSLDEAVGRELAPKAVIECFGCHSAPQESIPGNVQRGTLEWTRTLAPGVQCENCHQGSARHATQLAPMPKLVQISTEEQSDLCGQCHRTWADIAANGPRGVGNVRFQPYRIARSKCYDAADRRIACTACHDPHSRGNQTVAKFDAACQNCHVKGCRTAAKSDCASCHMPKYELSGSHHQFTDHWIRTVRNRNEYPD